MRLDSDQTQALLQQAAPSLHATPEQLLLAALAVALRGWLGEAECLIELDAPRPCRFPGAGHRAHGGLVHRGLPAAVGSAPGG